MDFTCVLLFHPLPSPLSPPSLDPLPSWERPLLLWSSFHFAHCSYFGVSKYEKPQNIAACLICFTDIMVSRCTLFLQMTQMLQVFSSAHLWLMQLPSWGHSFKPHPQVALLIYRWCVLFDVLYQEPCTRNECFNNFLEAPAKLSSFISGSRSHEVRISLPVFLICHKLSNYN